MKLWIICFVLSCWKVAVSVVWIDRRKLNHLCACNFCIFNQIHSSVENLHGIMRYTVAGFFTHGRKKYSNLISWESRTVKNVPFRVNGIWLLRSVSRVVEACGERVDFPIQLALFVEKSRKTTWFYTIRICWSSNTFHVSLIRVRCNTRCYYR